jgi:hypothetical protein
MGKAASLMVGLVLLGLATVENCHAWGQSAKKKREAGYQAALQSYSNILKPGMTRKSVEEYFRAKGITFGQWCCIDERSAYADLVKIGREKHPWYCEQHNVYIAFQFAAVEPHKGYEDDSDTLKIITVFHQLEGCL